MKYQTKDIEGFPGYRIDTNGDVWSCWDRLYVKGVRGHESIRGQNWKKLKPTKERGGYKSVVLYRKGAHRKKIHRLLALTFIPNLKGLPFVCHRDGDAKNNELRNLYWGTPLENAQDKKRHGTNIEGVKVHCAKLNARKAIKIRELYREKRISQRELAAMFEVSRRTIVKVLKGISWKHVTNNL